MHLEPRKLTGRPAELRAMANVSLSTFSEAFYPGYVASRFHELLASRLEDALKRNVKRIILNVPPQHGKSITASVCFPAWALTKHPTLRIFQAGHTGQLSKGFSRQTRDLVQSERYKSIYPDLTNKKIAGTTLWHTKLGGYYYATSVGGGTGVPADILLIDDPHRDRAAANSKRKRDTVWDWFTSTAMTRLAPDGIVIVIQTRWHRDDLTGRLTDPKRVAELERAGFTDANFEVISIEALCENPAKDLLGRQLGGALWPEVRTKEWLNAQRLSIGSFEWNALYQQRPNPPGGNIVDIKKVKIVKLNQVPRDIEFVRGWDLSVSDKNLADYSAGVRGGMDRNGNLWIVHVDRDKRLWRDQKARMFHYMDRESIGGRVGIEAVGAWETAVADIREKYQGRVIVTSYSPTVDKLTRALPWLARIDGGMFYMVEGDWNQDFLDEIEQFPNCPHDDQIDATTVLWEMLAKFQQLVMA
jgi:predicted phage terminase large subunit-like protein